MQTILKMTEYSNSSSLDEDKVRVFSMGGEKAIDEMWPVVAPLIKKALPYAEGKLDLEDVKKALLSSDMQLWVACDSSGIFAACVTQIIKYPQSDWAVILFVGGIRIHELLNAQIITDWAKDAGCSHIECWGRPGWERLLNRHGYPVQKIHTVLQLKL